MATATHDVEGRAAFDVNGDRVGTIGQVYVDAQNGRPLWVTISTGLFGLQESFAPLHGATTDGDNLRLTVTKDMVQDAPRADAGAHVKGNGPQALFTYYEGFLADD
jgi:hypothetical protein